MAGASVTTRLMVRSVFFQRLASPQPIQLCVCWHQCVVDNLDRGHHRHWMHATVGPWLGRLEVHAVFVSTVRLMCLVLHCMCCPVRVAAAAGALDLLIDGVMVYPSPHQCIQLIQ